MVKVAIAEDNHCDFLKLEAALLKMANKIKIEIVIDYYDSAVKLLAKFEVNYDIIFLDIEMPNLSGMEAAKKIREIDKSVMIIFVTNLANMAISVYEVEAFDFIVKPINYDTFYLKMIRALGKLNNNKGSSITIKCKGEIVNIKIDSIKYIESRGHYFQS